TPTAPPSQTSAALATPNARSAHEANVTAGGAAIVGVGTGAWVGLATKRQLSLRSGIPSPSASGNTIVPDTFAVNVPGCTSSMMQPASVQPAWNRVFDDATKCIDTAAVARSIVPVTSWLALK